MATDRFGVEELLTGVDPDAIRFCPIHRLPHDPDALHYHGAGRLCPKGGERLVGYLARFREPDGTPGLELPDDFWGSV